MDRLQRIADYARKQRGKGIVLRGNETCLLLGEHGARLPLNRVMASEELDALLREALPPELAERFDVGESFTFTHPSSEGELSVRVARAGGVVEVVIALPGDTPLESAPTAIQRRLESPTLTSPPPPVALPVDLAPAGAAAPPLAVHPPSPPAATPDGPRPIIEFPRDYLPGLFRAALAAPASDVQLEAGSRPWARIGGEVGPLDYGRALSADQLQAALFELLPRAAQARWIADGTAEFCFTFEDRARIRCTLFPGALGLCASCRLLPLQPPTLEEIQAPGFLTDLARAERGLVLLGGVRGSGTTTTLAALLHTLAAHRRARIVTVDQPIEFLHRPDRALVTQVEVPTHAPTTREALHRLALADLDVCAIGDASDPTVLRAAVRLAEEGALVLGIIRQPDVPGLVEHLLDCVAATSRQPGERIVRVLRGVICQRLCRPRRPGRPVPLFELLNVGSSAAALIRQGKPRDLHGAMFMTFDNALIGCVKEDKISAEEALRQATDPDNVRRLLASV